jgi:hypothetical protein
MLRLMLVGAINSQSDHAHLIAEVNVHIDQV